MTRNIRISLRNLSRAQHSGVIPYTCSSTQFSCLPIIEKRHENLWQLKALPSSIRAIDTGSLCQQSNETVKVRKHHLGSEVDARPDTVIVTEVLSVFILLKFGVRED